jgi:RNA polymerase sigma factor (sigma-70 family)
MSGVRAKGLHQDLAVIFGGGAAAALTDGQLLDRFLGPADETSEQAFEALVRRHGPMVLRVCHQVLGDSHEADDAFQAVFLILARTGCSVLQRESVASWLYGVALRVAARARKGLIKRRRVEQLADDDLDAVEAPILEGTVRWNESAEIVHQEVSRLAEKYRAPIVLCYLEGLTHDQAAARLNWPVGTVRSRLSRGRDRLRGRLSRRGVTAPALLGPLTGWLGVGGGSSAEAAALARAILPAVPAGLVTATLRSACQFASGKSAAVALFSAASLALTKEVLRTMAMKRIAVAAWALVPAGFIVFAAGTMLGQEPGREGGQGAPAVQSKEGKRQAAPAAAVEKTKVLVDPLERELLDAARQRLEAQRAYYEEGRITIDRFIMGSQRLMEIERMLSQTKEEALAAIQRHVDRLKEIEAREQGELTVGKGTVADVSEAHQNRLEAEVLLKHSKMPEKPNPELSSLERRLSELERKLNLLLNQGDGERRRR